MLLWLAVVIVCGLLLWRFALRYHFSALQSIPRAPGSSWLHGAFFDILNEEQGEVHLRFVKVYGNIVWWKFVFGSVDLLLADPTAVTRVHGPDFVKPAVAASRIRAIVGGESLLTYEGSVHQFHRSRLNPAFSLSAVNEMLPVIDEKANQLVRKWLLDTSSSSYRVAAAADLSRSTFDVICQVGFGADFNSLEKPDAALTGHFTNVLSGIGLSWKSLIPLYHRLPLPENRRRHESRAAVEGFLLRLIEEKQHGSQGNKKRPDLLDLLLDPQNEPLTDDELMRHLVTFAFAGHETTATAMTWTLWLLSRHPEHRKRAQQECRAVLAQQHSDELSLSSLDQMRFTLAVIKESMRMYPPAPINFRVSATDTVLGGYHVPAGTNILISAYVQHHHPQFWERPDEFWPERWLQAGFAPSSGVYMPFGGGNHNCIGQRLAMLELRVFMARILAADFDFTSPAGYKPTRQNGITMKMNPPLELELSH